MLISSARIFPIMLDEWEVMIEIIHAVGLRTENNIVEMIKSHELLLSPRLRIFFVVDS